jgi:hypothetical protein
MGAALDLGLPSCTNCDVFHALREVGVERKVISR